MAKVDIFSQDSKVLDKTLKDILGLEYLLQPMSSENIISAIEKLPFTMHIIFSKITGKWICTNVGVDVAARTKTSFIGVNFTVTDFTMEKACARAIHYYYHLKIRE